MENSVEVVATKNVTAKKAGIAVAAVAALGGIGYGVRRLVLARRAKAEEAGATTVALVEVEKEAVEPTSKKADK